MTDVTQLEINREALPHLCAHVHPDTHDCIITTFGQSGYYQAPDIVAAEYNRARNISPAQQAAHLFGSMWGWDLTGANPLWHSTKKTPTPNKCAKCDNPAWSIHRPRSMGYKYCETCAAEIGEKK